MINNLTSSRPYAKAIFSLALEKNKIEEWMTLLESFSVILEDKTASEILNNPNITLSKKLDFFFALIKEELVPNKGDVINLIKILAGKHYLSIIPEIKDFYKKISQAHANILPAKVISAFSLDKEQLQKMQTVLEKKFRSNIVIDNSENPDLIGGAVVYISDWVIDGSIKGKLQKLRDEFRLE